MTRNENYTKWYKLQKCCLPVMVAHASWYSRGCCWKEDVRNTNARSGIKETKKKPSLCTKRERCSTTGLSRMRPRPTEGGYPADPRAKGRRGVGQWTFPFSLFLRWCCFFLFSFFHFFLFWILILPSFFLFFLFLKAYLHPQKVTITKNGLLNV